MASCPENVIITDLLILSVHAFFPSVFWHQRSCAAVCRQPRSFRRRAPAFCEMRVYSFRSFPVFLTDNLYNRELIDSCRSGDQSDDQHGSGLSGADLSVVVPEYEQFVQQAQPDAEDGREHEDFAELSAHQSPSVLTVCTEPPDIFEYLTVRKSYVLASRITDDFQPQRYR